MRKIDEEGLKGVAGGIRKDAEDVKIKGRDLRKKLGDEDPPAGGSPDPESEDPSGGTQDLF